MPGARTIREREGSACKSIAHGKSEAVARAAHRAKTSLWNIWRAGLPTNGRVEAAAEARLRATARAVDPHVSRTSRVSRVAVALYEVLKRADAGPAFREAPLRRILLAAARLHGAG